VLIVRLVSGRPPLDEERGGRPDLGEFAGVVVLDLVVVPGDEPGKGRVCRLQILVRAVESVAVAEIPERRDPPVVGADVAAGGDVLAGPYS
jgi:hypothetical protein